MTARAPVDFKRAALFLILFALIVLLWNTRAIYPLRILVVLFHELSHGIAAIVTGGSIVEMQISAQEGGQCLTRGGNAFLILSAGYLGSLLWGGLLLLIASRTNWGSIALEVLGALLIIVSVVWVRPLASFGFAFGMLAGAAIIALAYFSPPNVDRTILVIVGLTSCLYAVLDIKSDILDRPHLESDAAMLAAATGIPTILWGVLWLAISIFVAARLLLIACRPTTAHTTPVAESSPTS